MPKARATDLHLFPLMVTWDRVWRRGKAFACEVAHGVVVAHERGVCVVRHKGKEYRIPSEDVRPYKGRDTLKDHLTGVAPIKEAKHMSVVENAVPSGGAELQ